MDASRVQRIREEMQRAEARRLQPYFIESFFLEAFPHLGGAMREREPRRHEVTHVPAVIRSRDRLIGTGAPVLQRYERIAFEKGLLNVAGKPQAAFVCPGHPLLDATIDLVLERHGDLMRQGAVLVDPDDPGETPRVLVYLEHDIQDARTDRSGNQRTISRRMQFVEIDPGGVARSGGYAPYLDYRPLAEDERPAVESVLNSPWIRDDIENRAISHAIERIVPEHLEEVRKAREELIYKTMAAVKDRLTKEITHWTNRAEQLRLQEAAGKVNANLNSSKAQQRADELEARMQKRLQELEQEKQISPKPPVVRGAALVIPAGLLGRLRGEPPPAADPAARKAVELRALEAVISAERSLGHEPVNISDQRLPWDIESRIPGSSTGESRIRFIEVKGRWAGAPTVTISRNEILTALNKPEDFVLALVQVDDEKTDLRYLWRPFTREPDFGVTSVNYDFGELWKRGAGPQ